MAADSQSPRAQGMTLSWKMVDGKTQGLQLRLAELEGEERGGRTWLGDAVGHGFLSFFLQVEQFEAPALFDDIAEAEAGAV